MIAKGGRRIFGWNSAIRYLELLSVSCSRHGKQPNGEVDGAIPFEYNRETGTEKRMSFVEMIVGTSYLSFCSCPGLVW